MAEDPIGPISGDPDPEFEPSERLFRRIPPVHFEGGFLSDAFVPFPAFSTNREKYSRPEDIIAAHPRYGIAAFAVGDIPPVLDDFAFRAEHRPEPDNYSHTEVLSLREGDLAEPPRILRKRFRDLLRQRIRVLKAPS